MGNSTSTNKNSNLATEIDRIASKYILSQNFSDMNKMSEKDHCDKVMILTAKIINQNINPLEQKEIVKRIENGNASKEESKDKKEDEKKKEGKKKEGEEGEEGEEEVTTKKSNKEDDKKIKKKKGEEGEEGEEEEGEEGEEEEEEPEEGEKAAKKKKKKGGAEPLPGEATQAAPPVVGPPAAEPPQAEPPQAAPPAVGPTQALTKAEPPIAPPQAEPTKAEPTKAEPPIAPPQAPTQTEPTKAAPSTPTPSKSEPTSEGVEGGEPPCVTIAKFYVKIAHLYAAIMKTVNPVIISTDKNGKIQKYDLMSKQTIPTDIEIQSIEHNNFCTKRLNNLIQDSDYNERDPKNILMTLKPRFCNINYNKATKSTRKFYEEERKKTGASEAGASEAGASEAGAGASEAGAGASESNEEAASEAEASEAENEEKKSIDKDKGADKDETPLNESNSELGIPELMKLYYDVFDETTNDYTSMSDSMRDIYEHDVETFYTTFTGKPMPVDENGQALITRFDQIPLRDYHKNDKCKPGNMFTQNYEGSLNDKLFKDYAMHINKMMTTMNTNQNKLYKILQQLFKFQEPKKKEKKKDEPKEKPKEEPKEEEESKAPTTQGQIVIANMQQAGPTDAAAPGPTDAAAPGPTDAAAPGPTDAAAPLPPPGPLPTDAPLPEAPVPTQEAAPAPVPVPAPAALPVPAPAPVPVPVEETPVDSTKSGDIKVGGSDDDNVPDNVPDDVPEEESVIIHPNLDDKLLQSLINTTRKLIVELYVTCETHFLEGIVLFESIVAVQLAKTTGSQIKLLNDATINYLEHHTNNNL